MAGDFVGVYSGGLSVEYAGLLVGVEAGGFASYGGDFGGYFVGGVLVICRLVRLAEIYDDGVRRFFELGGDHLEGAVEGAGAAMGAVFGMGYVYLGEEDLGFGGVSGDDLLFFGGFVLAGFFLVLVLGVRAGVDVEVGGDFVFDCV